MCPRCQRVRRLLLHTQPLCSSQCMFRGHSVHTAERARCDTRTQDCRNVCAQYLVAQLLHEKFCVHARVLALTAEEKGEIGQRQRGVRMVLRVYVSRHTSKCDHAHRELFMRTPGQPRAHTWTATRAHTHACPLRVVSVSASERVCCCCFAPLAELVAQSHTTQVPFVLLFSQAAQYTVRL